MYIYIYIHVCICRYVYIYIYMYLFIYYACLHVCVYVCVTHILYISFASVYMSRTPLLPQALVGRPTYFSWEQLSIAASRPGVSSLHKRGGTDVLETNLNPLANTSRKASSKVWKEFVPDPSKGRRHGRSCCSTKTKGVRTCVEKPLRLSNMRKLQRKHTDPTSQSKQSHIDSD